MKVHTKIRKVPYHDTKDYETFSVKCFVGCSVVINPNNQLTLNSQLKKIRHEFSYSVIVHFPPGAEYVDKKQIIREAVDFCQRKIRIQNNKKYPVNLS